MGIDSVRVDRMNCFGFVENICADLLVRTPRNTFSRGWKGGSVKKKLEECWTVVQAALCRQ